MDAAHRGSAALGGSIGSLLYNILPLIAGQRAPAAVDIAAPVIERGVVVIIGRGERRVAARAPAEVSAVVVLVGGERIAIDAVIFQIARCEAYLLVFRHREKTIARRRLFLASCKSQQHSEYGKSHYLFHNHMIFIYFQASQQWLCPLLATAKITKKSDIANFFRKRAPPNQLLRGISPIKGLLHSSPFLTFEKLRSASASRAELERS